MSGVPEITKMALQDMPLLEWYRWGAILGFVIVAAAATWILTGGRRSGHGAATWRSLAVIAGISAILALLAGLHEGFALQLRELLLFLAYLSMGAVLVASLAALGYAITRSRPLLDRPEEREPPPFRRLGPRPPSGGPPPAAPSLRPPASGPPSL